jgi:hypothetical protein
MQSKADYNFGAAIFYPCHIYASTSLSFLQTQGNGGQGAVLSINADVGGGPDRGSPLSANGNSFVIACSDSHLGEGELHSSNFILRAGSKRFAGARGT